jgi:hypothetical protein
MENNPVIIIAAARSGTKMLRAALESSNELIAFPYDINYIWKYGNYNVPHDELTKQHLTPEIKKFIRSKFEKLLLDSNAERIVEKTVSNSLRVGFVKEVFSNCKIIHLYRDGRDVAVSARECWKASMFSKKIQPTSDIFKKAIHFPITRSWFYLLNYLSNYASKFFKSNNRLKSWGPKYKGIDEIVKNEPLIKVCGVQWAKSINHCLEALSKLEENKDYINIKYEELVKEPIKNLRRIARFVNVKNFEPIGIFAKNKISDKYIGNWKYKLSREELNYLLPILHKPLKKLDYI